MNGRKSFYYMKKRRLYISMTQKALLPFYFENDPNNLPFDFRIPAKKDGLFHNMQI